MHLPFCCPMDLFNQEQVLPFLVQRVQPGMGGLGPLGLAPWPDSLAGLLERPFVTPPRILGLLALNLPLLAKEEMSVVCGPGSGPQGQTSGNSWAMMHLPSNLISIMLGRKNTWGC